MEVKRSKRLSWVSMLRILLSALTCFTCTTVLSHEARPIHVQVEETGPGQVRVQWNLPLVLSSLALPVPELPANCQPRSASALRKTSAAYVGEQIYGCPDGLSGQQLGIRFPSINPALTTLFQVRLLSGEQHIRMLKPGDYHWVVPNAEDPFAIANQYTWLGIEHIWVGVDHLLFVACLLFIARTPRRVVLTITGFTIAHSVTLALSALQLVRLPTPPVEAVIALSVVFLAVEIARGDRNSLTFRYPVAVSSSFGLLHGFGFASVLREIGLPSTELPLALLFFNVGVEIGQLLFIGGLVASYVLLRKVFGMMQRTKDVGKGSVRLSLAASYVIGTVASYWMFERLSGAY